MKRIAWIDIVKGWGIVLMVIGHMPIPQVAKEWIFSFHMPLFFFFSGYLYNPNKYRWLDFVERKMRTLLIPYATFFVLTVATSYFLLGRSVESMFPKYFLWGCGGWPIWFLYVLFMTEVVCDFLFRLAKGKLSHILAAGLLLSAISYILYKNHLHYPYKLEVVGMSSLYFVFGYATKRIPTLDKQTSAIPVSMTSHIAIALLILLDVVLSFVITPDLNMVGNVLGIFMPTILLALFGIWLSVQVSHLIMRNKWAERSFSYLGKNTIVVLGVASPIWFGVTTALKNVSAPYIVRTSVVFVLTWGGVFLLIYIINKHCPILIGKTKKK